MPSAIPTRLADFPKDSHSQGIHWRGTGVLVMSDAHREGFYITQNLHALIRIKGSARHNFTPRGVTSPLLKKPSVYLVIPSRRTMYLTNDRQQQRPRKCCSAPRLRLPSHVFTVTNSPAGLLTSPRIPCGVLLL
jgi:hypothetical protein